MFGSDVISLSVSQYADVVNGMMVNLQTVEVAVYDGAFNVTHAFILEASKSCKNAQTVEQTTHILSMH